MNNDTLLIEQRPMPKSFKVETPIGSLESDSGNHYVDVASILLVFVVLYFIYGRKIIG
jgi:hypothetical protein